MYYTSNERDYYALSIDVSNFENIYGGWKWYLKRNFFYFYFWSFISQPILYLMVSNFGRMYLIFMSGERCLRFFFHVLVFILCQKRATLWLFIWIFFSQLTCDYWCFSDRPIEPFYSILWDLWAARTAPVSIGRPLYGAWTQHPFFLDRRLIFCYLVGPWNGAFRYS